MPPACVNASETTRVRQPKPLVIVLGREAVLRAPALARTPPQVAWVALAAIVAAGKGAVQRRCGCLGQARLLTAEMPNPRLERRGTALEVGLATTAAKAVAARAGRVAEGAVAALLMACSASSVKATSVCRLNFLLLVQLRFSAVRVSPHRRRRSKQAYRTSQATTHRRRRSTSTRWRVWRR